LDENLGEKKKRQNRGKGERRERFHRGYSTIIKLSIAEKGGKPGQDKLK